MKNKLAKEIILTALRRGKVSYISVGRHISPFKAREFLLKVADHIENLKEVDLSIAFDKRPEVSKVATHGANFRPTVQQNQHQ